MQDFNNLSDEQLDSLVMQKMNSQAAPQDLSNLSDDEIDNLVAQKLQTQTQPEFNPRAEEADLGFLNRAQYSLEPIQSNRDEFLRQKFGKENVLVRDGETYLKQENQYRPVNQDGIGVSDIAEFAGATPEMIGTGLGVVAGLGPGSIPGAMVGGVAGSAVRQGLSTLIGTPQVATTTERAMEAGLSGLFSGAIPVIGQGVKATKPYVKNAVGKVANAGKQYVQKATDYLDDIFKVVPSEKQVLETSTDLVVEQAPRELADQSGRKIVQEETEKLNKIAKDQNLPAPTYAQTVGGKAILAEGQALDTPIIGGGLRKYVDNQLDKVKQNLEKEAGEFIHSDSTGDQVGFATRNILSKSIEGTKEIAKNLYTQVDELGKDAMVGARHFFNKYKDEAAKNGLVNPDGTKSLYDPTSRLTRDEFSKLQNVFFDGMESIRNTGSDKIRFQAVDSLRRTVKNQADEWAKINPNASRLLYEFHNNLDSTAERVLNREVPKLGKVYQDARKQWAKFKDDKEFLEKFMPDNLGDEKVVKKLMNDSFNVKRIKEVIGEGATKEIGKSYVKDILSGLAKSGVARADTALSAIRKQRSAIISSIGEKSYKNLTDNLHYLNRLNQGLNVQRTSLYNIFDDSKGGLKGFAVRLGSVVKNYSEMKGGGIAGAAKRTASSASKPVKKVYSMTPKTRGGLSNLFTDDLQRGFSRNQVIDLEPINIGSDESNGERRPSGR